MQFLYVDNFRGFLDTYIPIKDVNFLVGENSTGKTSILSLIELLSDPIFWLTFDFSTNNVDLGYFKEIVSQKQAGANFFSIGFIKFKPENNEDNETILMKFKNDNGVPIISEFNFIEKNNFDIRIIFTKNKIKYKIEKIDQNSTKKSTINFFEEWIESINTSQKKGFKYFKENLEKRKSLPLIRAIIEEEISHKQKDTEFEIPIFIEFLTCNAPIRAKPKRIYENYNVHYSPEGEHAPHVLKNILNSKKIKSREIVSKYLEPFGQSSALFDKIIPKSYGNDQLSPYEINIILNDQQIKISNVGYGVSQVLPIITDMISLQENSTLVIQQPEVHLHPKAQAALGEFIYNIHIFEKKKFLIETHSEYLINRFRIISSKNKEKNIDSQVIFFERTDKGNKIHVIEIHNGQYSENQPKSFSDFFIKEELKLLEI